MDAKNRWLEQEEKDIKREWKKKDESHWMEILQIFSVTVLIFFCASASKVETKYCNHFLSDDKYRDYC